MTWTPLTKASAAETQREIEKVIGLSRSTFRASAFLAQSDGAAFTEAQPRDRKRILAEVVGLDRWDILLARARTDKQQLQALVLEQDVRIRQAEEHAAQADEVQRELDAVVEAETTAADNLADLERSHAELAVDYQAAREHAARRQAAQAELETAAAAMRDLDQRTVAADHAARTIVDAIAQLENLPSYPPLDELRQREAELETKISQHRDAVAAHELADRTAKVWIRERDQLIARAHEADTVAEAVRGKIRELEEHEGATCQTCGQSLPDDAKARAIASYEGELEERVESASIARGAAQNIAIPIVPPAPEGEPPTIERDLVRSQIRAAQEQQTKTATLRERMTQLEAAAAAGPSPEEVVAAKSLLLERQDALTELGEGKDDLAVIERKGKIVAEQLRDVRAQLEQHRSQRARLDERLTAARAASEQATAATEERDRLQVDLDTVLALERAFSPDGIPALIVENTAIPYLETEANRILGMLGGKTASCQVELRTQAELKSGDGVRDTIDVIVTGPAGARPYETFSGGEKTRLNLALRIALARLLAHRRGAESRLLVIDEPEGLDEAGVAALVDVLRGLQDDFEKLYVVSHVPALRDSFDTTLACESVDGERSQVVEGDVFAEVAA